VIPRTLERTARVAWLIVSGVAAMLACATVETFAEESASNPKLTALSLEELMRLDVSTVSRKAEQWWSAPGAIDVVTGEDIRRSGVMNLPDALRLATGIHVGQPNAREWAVAARGFNVGASNKLNVQLDGRSLFTPFFSGVLWDAQDTLLEDIDRIEVQRGPGGAMWGAYAVNGFIQILTRPAWETQGWLASAGAGTETPEFLSMRYGGKTSDSTFYRVYGKYSQFDWSYPTGGGPRTAPKTDFAQTGFRVDTRATDSVFTLQGDAYTNKGTPEDHVQNEISGANLTARGSRVFASDAELSATAYYDYTLKNFAVQFFERRNTISGSVKYRIARGPHEFQIGAEGLASWDLVSGPIVTFEPSRRTFVSASAFLQDVITLVPKRWSVTAGGQLLYNGSSGLDVQPTLRLAWTPDERTTLWAAASRAVRPPVRIDRDLVVRFGGTLVFEGNDDLKSEEVVAYELGARHSFGERLAVDLATFVNHYNNLRSYESSTSTFMAFPWTFKNTTNAHSSGAELTVLYQPVSRVFVKASYRYLDLHLTKDAGSGDFQDGLFEMNDPHQVASLTVRVDLPHNVEFDTTLRYAGRLPRPAMDAYTTADARIGWTPRPGWEISITGQNLLDPRHPDFVTPNDPNEELARSVTFKSTWRF
jgi:iron complex outermembrane receptor protein